MNINNKAVYKINTAVTIASNVKLTVLKIANQAITENKRITIQ